MTADAVARRYAAAFFDVTTKAGNTDRAAAELAAFNQVIEGHAELARIFQTPAVPPQKKKAIVEAMLRAMDLASPEVGRTLQLLAERDRLAALPKIVAALMDRVTAARRVVPADVVTAVPIDDARRAALAAALSKAMGADVRMTATVDPSILGGVVARVGGFVFDGSVARQLERLRERLVRDGA